MVVIPFLVLLQAAGLAQLGSVRQRFEGTVPASCAITPFAPVINLSLRGNRLIGESASFSVKSNVPVRLALARVEPLNWPTPAGGGTVPQPSASLIGNGPYRIRLEVEPPSGLLLPPGSYRALVQVDCLLSAP